MNKKYETTQQPIKIGGVTIRNRIFLPSHTTNFGIDHLPTEEHEQYYSERARGGVGLVIVEPLRVSITSLSRPGGLYGNHTQVVAPLARVVESIQGGGARAFAQITHTGRHSDNKEYNISPIGPSEIPWISSGKVPRAMTRRDLLQVRQDYVTTAKKAVKAGIEGLEVHFGHGHLLHQFLSPLSNNREDEYGGTLSNRSRYPREILDAVLDAVGSDVPVGIRISMEETYLDGGLSFDEVKHLVQTVAQENTISFINTSVASYNWPSIGAHVPDNLSSLSPWRQMTEELAGTVPRVVVMTTGRYRTLEDIENTLKNGVIDLVGMVRPLIADPNLVTKELSGNSELVRPCVYTNFCIQQIADDRKIQCAVNTAPSMPTEPLPVVVRQRSVRLRPRVAVIGGGPAGLAAAVEIARNEIAVDLYEKNPKLGGSLISKIEDADPFGDLRRLYRYLARDLERSPLVSLVLENPVRDLADLRGTYHGVVVATGSSSTPLLVPQLHEFISSSPLPTHVYDKEGGWASYKYLVALSSAGLRTHLHIAGDQPLWEVPYYSRMVALERLKLAEITVHSHVTRDAFKKQFKVGCDSNKSAVVNSAIVKSPKTPTSLLDSLYRAGIPNTAIGDANGFRQLPGVFADVTHQLGSFLADLMSS